MGIFSSDDMEEYQCAVSFDKGFAKGYKIGFIEGIKSIIATRVLHGRWVHVHRYDGSPYQYECSVCEHTTQFRDDRYCPCCGAKMDKESEDENTKTVEIRDRTV